MPGGRLIVVGRTRWAAVTQQVCGEQQEGGVAHQGCDAAEGSVLRTDARECGREGGTMTEWARGRELERLRGRVPYRSTERVLSV